MNFKNLAAAAFCLATSVASIANAATEAIKMPVNSDGNVYELNGILITNGDEKAPLAVISHGTAGKGDDSKSVTEAFLAQGEEFARRGFMVLLVERRGYGLSKENMSEVGGPCEARNYNKSGQSAARDILGAINHVKANYKFDQSRVLLVGRSSGGYSSIYAGGFKDPAIKAVISISGGRGADKQDGTICSQDNLLKILGKSGSDYAAKGVDTPTLWVYAENDQSFAPAFAKQMFDAFVSGGGKGELVMTGAFQANGHNLFSQAGASIWVPIVDSFLKKINF